MIVRWNAKKIMVDAKYKQKKINDNTKNEMNNKLDNIQMNLTNKLIRTFLRLACHYNNITIDSFPYELDSALHIKINSDINMQCNNQLLLETGEMIIKGSNDLLK